jgi:hypothetical protein
MGEKKYSGGLFLLMLFCIAVGSSLHLGGQKPVLADCHADPSVHHWDGNLFLSSLTDLEVLRANARSPEGKQILTILTNKLKSISDPFELSSSAVGYALLYLIDNDSAYLSLSAQAALNTVRDSIAFRSERQDGNDFGLWKSDYKAIYRSELLMDIATAYDICKQGWPVEVREEIADQIFQKAKIMMPGNSYRWDQEKDKYSAIQGEGYNPNPWSNWQGIVNSGVGMAFLTLSDHPEYGDMSRQMLDTTLVYFMDHFNYFGDFMWTAEGFNYLRYELAAGTAPFILAYRNRIDPDFLKGTSLNNLARFFISQSAIINDRIYTPVYGQLQSKMEMTRWRSGIWLLIMGLSGEKDRAALKWIFDRVYGLNASGNFNIYQAKDALYALLYYPYEQQAIAPDNVYPLTLYDKKQGYCIFRNRWGEGEILATILDNSQARRGAHSHNDAGSIRLLGLGEEWIYKADRNLRTDPSHMQHSVDYESLVKVEGANNWTGGRIISYKSYQNGGGEVIIDMQGAYTYSNWFLDQKDVGVNSAIREFRVQFPDERSALISVRDKIEGGGEKTWQIATPQKKIKLEDSGFTLFSDDSTRQLKVNFTGNRKPDKISLNLDLVQVFFGEGDLDITAVMELSILPETQSTDLRNTKIDGYRGIWFELNQKYEYGDKYSGGLGTYTAKHIPLAVYSPVANKTFFVYGGTTTQNERHLLCMAGEYNHRTGKVSKPTVAYDKITLNDPHDNPTIMIDDEGYIRVFVSGRGRKRPGIKLKSTNPYSIEEFNIISEEEFTYPQVWNTNQGYFHFFTKYTGVRELYFESSQKGSDWSDDIKIAGIPSGEDSLAGHYQLSNIYNDGEIIGTFFNRHVNGHPDSRTDLYYMQTRDHGKTWLSVSGDTLELPVDDIESKARVADYLSEKKNIYMKDMAYDESGNPVCLYITSNGHEPGPANAPYQWRLIFWRNKAWRTVNVCESDHNYDMGSLYIEGSKWRIVAPSEDPPQAWGVGGEIAIWRSRDNGTSWSKKRLITGSSSLNHSYIRRPLNYKSPFCFFWATGDPHNFGVSELYFGNFKGKIRKLPYNMDQETLKPDRFRPKKGRKIGLSLNMRIL